jgi:glycine cleavage system aminomethyltransferase T
MAHPITSLSLHPSTLSTPLNKIGGVGDNVIVVKHSENASCVITNARRREWDFARFAQRIDERSCDSDRSKKGKVEREVSDRREVLALQGPEATRICRCWHLSPARGRPTQSAYSRCHCPLLQLVSVWLLPLDASGLRGYSVLGSSYNYHVS